TADQTLISRAMHDSNSRLTLRVDRRALVGILSNEKVVQSVFDLSEAMERLPDTEPLLEQLLEGIEQRIPFDYGAALLVRGNDGDLDAAASRGQARAAVLRTGAQVLSELPCP